MLDKIDLETIVSIAQKAGDAIMEIYGRDFQVDYKDDKSPLTEADTRSNEIICEALAKAYPDIPLLSEENKEVPYEERKDWEYFWLIDPIDGTNSFRNGLDTFGFTLTLVKENTALAAAIDFPKLGNTYIAYHGHGVTQCIRSGREAAESLMSL